MANKENLCFLKKRNETDFSKIGHLVNILSSKICKNIVEHMLYSLNNKIVQGVLSLLNLILSIRFKDLNQDKIYLIQINIIVLIELYFKNCCLFYLYFYC